MATDEQGIITMLQEKITAHEEKIKTFRQAIAALSGEEENSEPTPSQKNGRRRGRKRGRKRGSKNALKQNTENGSSANASSTPKKRGPKPKNTRGRKRGRPRSTDTKSGMEKKSPVQRNISATLESWVMDQLADNTPKTNRTLLELYNRVNAANLDMKGFSARISMIKKKRTLMSGKNGNNGANYIGKADWFSRGKLKEPYLSKIAS